MPSRIKVYIVELRQIAWLILRCQFLSFTQGFTWLLERQEYQVTI